MSDLVNIPRGDPTVYAPGTWELVFHEDEGDTPSYYSAVIWCPECGRPLSLQRGHHIDTEGRITPSVGHPEQYLQEQPCDWHVSPRLLGWPNLTPPPPREFSTCARCGEHSRSLSGWGTDGRYAGIICTACKKTLALEAPRETPEDQ